MFGGGGGKSTGEGGFSGIAACPILGVVHSINPPIILNAAATTERYAPVSYLQLIVVVSTIGNFWLYVLEIGFEAIVWTTCSTSIGYLLALFSVQISLTTLSMASSALSTCSFSIPL